jgi:hypothetical protein
MIAPPDSVTGLSRGPVGVGFRTTSKRETIAPPNSVTGLSRGPVGVGFRTML